MWLFAVKYLQIFLPKEFWGRRGELIYFLLSFHEAFQVHIQKLSAPILHFLGFEALLGLKIKSLFLLRQMMLHFLKITLILNNDFLCKVTLSLFASFMKICLKTYLSLLICYLGAWHLSAPNSPCTYAFKSDRKIRDLTDQNQLQSSPFPFPLAQKPTAWGCWETFKSFEGQRGKKV